MNASALPQGDGVAFRTDAREPVNIAVALQISDSGVPGAVQVVGSVIAND
jgi:hypothetical protein